VKRVLHISADHPDAYSPRKTEAVRNLIEGTPAFDHRVYSINRLSGFGGITVLERTRALVTLVYRAPAYGILLETFLKRLADWIIEDSLTLGLKVDVVHGHKLTIEGLVARRVATALGCPYVCTVRGNTDQKYMRLKPEKRAAYSQVAENAAMLLPGAPWIERYLVRRLSLRNGRRALLPTITKIDGFIAPSSENSRFVTAFHLDGWRLKGMPNLLAAIALLKEQHVDITLDIIGGGTRQATKALDREIRRRGLTGCVALCGAMQHERMPEALNRYAALVLPTLRESFGMVYIEALFSGVPILYSQDRGIDGYFDGQDIGVRCDPVSVADIARGLEELRSGAPRMKESIRKLQEEGGFDRFRKSTVCRMYEETLKSVCDEG
jgi:glycosyltransferase involved in cell wall biosynthesis